MAEAVVSAAVSTPSVAVPAPLPVRAVLPWALFVGLLALIALYFVGAEQGATSLFAGSDVHEWVHDGRHLLGFPCH
ncbi:CbtB-domain containing protein [Streptomyces sp. NPDC004520]|uniref:CbtB domain-containing protein n=1 Tax=unclassified Streptomyces TaxID=2593676 RepID=UPI0036D10541